MKAFRTGREMLSDKPRLRRVTATVSPRAVVSVRVRTVGPLYAGIVCDPDRQYGGKVLSKLKGSRPALKSDGCLCSVALSEYSRIAHERIQRTSLSVLSSVPKGFKTADPERTGERLPNPECEKKPSRNFKIWNRPLPTPMNFGIFCSSRGGNPQQSETNLNQKTPETLLLPGPLPFHPKTNEPAVPWQKSRGRRGGLLLILGAE